MIETKKLAESVLTIHKGENLKLEKIHLLLNGLNFGGMLLTGITMT